MRNTKKIIASLAVTCLLAAGSAVAQQSSAPLPSNTTPATTRTQGTIPSDPSTNNTSSMSSDGMKKSDTQSMKHKKTKKVIR